MKNEYIEEVAILRRYIKKDLPEKNCKKTLSLKSMQELQHKDYLRQMQAVIYKKQDYPLFG